MATVKTIDVALRANTENFSDGLAKGMSVMDRFAGNTQRAMASMDKAFHLFQKGAIGLEEYNRRVDAGEKELAAISAGFTGMGSAVARADSILSGLRTETERYQAELKELDSLLKLNVLSEQQHATAVHRTTTAYHNSIPKAQLVKESTDKLGLAYASNLPIIGRFSHLTAGIATPIGAAVAAIGGLTIGLAAIYKGFTTVADIVLPTIARLDATAKAADRLGVLTGEFQKLEYAAGLADVSTEELSTGMEKMSRNISMAVSGSKSQADAFKALGVNVKQLSTMTPDEAFLVLADAIAAVESPMDKLRLTMDVFGRSGAGFVNVFAEGAEGIKRAGDEAVEFGLVINQIDAAQVQIAADELTRLGKAFEGFATVVTTKVVGPFTVALEDLTKATQEPLAAIMKMLAFVSEFGNSKALAAFGLGTDLGDIMNRADAAREKLVEVRKEADKKLKPQVTVADIEIEASKKPLPTFDFSPTLRPDSKLGEDANAMDHFGESIQFANDLFREQQKEIEKRNQALAEASTRAGFQVPQMQAPAMPDMKPFREFQTKVEEWKKQLAAGKIDESVFTAGIEAAQTRLQVMHDLTKNIADKEAEINKRRLNTLAELRKAQEAAWAKENPAAAAQKEMSTKLIEINDLFRAQIISLEERNTLLAGVKKQAQNEADAPLMQAGEAIKKSVQNPFENFTDKVAELQKLRKGGFIDPETFTRAFANAREEFKNSFETNNPFQTKDRNVAAIEAGTQDAFKAFKQASSDTKKADEFVAEQKKTNQKFDQLLRRGVVLAAARL